MYRSLLLALGLLLTAYVPALAQGGGLPVPELPDPGDLFADEEMEMPPTEPEVKLSFIYLYATDLAAMRHFYTDLLGLSETSYQEGPEGWLGYKSGALEFLIFPAPAASPPAGWAVQPGWDGGTEPRVSWSIDVGPEKFRPTVAALKDSGAECFAADPRWCQDSYWAFPVRDPMGNTVEVYCTPPVRPQSTSWSWD